MPGVVVRPEVPRTGVALAVPVLPMTRIVPEVLKVPAARADVAMPEALAARVVLVAAPTVPVARLVPAARGVPVVPEVSVVPVMRGAPVCAAFRLRLALR